MSVNAFPTNTPGGIVLDLDNLVLEHDGTGLFVFSPDEAVRLRNQLQQSIVEVSLAVDPQSQILAHLDRVFA
jgi:hypothetical protein